METKENVEQGKIWEGNSFPDISEVFRSCLGYANTPGWAFIQRTILKSFGKIEGIRTIELGCGHGKVSLLFDILGAQTTMVDYSQKQIQGASFVSQKFGANQIIHHGNVFNLPESFFNRYDISMSFGTAEHFFGEDRQKIFDIHAKTLKRGGLSFIWVPNAWGFLFHIGVKTRKLLRRRICPADEIPFSRKELLRRAATAGLEELEIVGGEFLLNDFNHFVIDIPKIFKLPKTRMEFEEMGKARNSLLNAMKLNQTRPTFLGNYFSYPLLISGRRLT